MKTLLILAVLVLSTSSAFAFTPVMVTKALAAQNVAEILENKNIKSITNGPSYRCMGCYALIIKTDNYDDRTVDTYKLQVMDFGGRLHADIVKMDDKTAE